MNMPDNVHEALGVILQEARQELPDNLKYLASTDEADDALYARDLTAAFVLLEHWYDDDGTGVDLEAVGKEVAEIIASYELQETEAA